MGYSSPPTPGGVRSRVSFRSVAGSAALGIPIRKGPPGMNRAGLFLLWTNCYVPISQEARYFTCSFVNVSIFIPMPASLSLAISLSITGGTG